MTATLTLDKPSFEYVRKFVHERSAIALEESKDYLVESRLLPVARQWGLASLAELVAQLQARPKGELHDQVVEAMTTNETSFFRDIHPFDALKTAILPELIKTRAACRSLNIWSAACSSGQEPYTIAMLLRETFPQLASWNVQIHASDLSQQMVDRATKGEFTQHEVNRGLPATLLLKYFQKVGLHWQAKPELRQMLRVHKVNLVEPWPKLPTMDVIFLRNVLIYFTPATKRQILSHMRKQLAKDGSLLLGGAETTLGIDDAWQRVNHGKCASYQAIGR